MKRAPELEYSERDKVRIYRDVINYVHKQNDKNTGSLLTRDNFDKLFGFLYFNLTYNNDSITADPRQIVLRYKFSSVPAAGPNYKKSELIQLEMKLLSYKKKHYHILYKMSFQSYSVSLTEGQKENLARAYKNRLPITITLQNDQLKENIFHYC